MAKLFGSEARERDKGIIVKQQERCFSIYANAVIYLPFSSKDSTYLSKDRLASRCCSSCPSSYLTLVSVLIYSLAPRQQSVYS